MLKYINTKAVTTETQWAILVAQRAIIHCVMSLIPSSTNILSEVCQCDKHHSSSTNPICCLKKTIVWIVGVRKSDNTLLVMKWLNNCWKRRLTLIILSLEQSQGYFTWFNILYVIWIACFEHIEQLLHLEKIKYNFDTVSRTLIEKLIAAAMAWESSSYFTLS